MRIGEYLYFSKNIKFKDIDLHNKSSLIDAYEDRLKTFYFTPIDKLNKDNHPFASGVLCVTTIDFLSAISTCNPKVGNRFEKWLINNIPVFEKKDTHYNKSYAKRFYEEFRNGLVHEGHIKRGGQFSYDINFVELEGSIMIINPEKLVQFIEEAFSRYLEDIKKDDEHYFDLFKCAIITYFRDEFETVNK